MGKVYLAEDEMPDRKVAIKVPDHIFGSNPEFKVHDRGFRVAKSK